MSRSIKDLLALADRVETEKPLDNPEIKLDTSGFDADEEIVDQYYNNFRVGNKGVRNGSGYAIERSNNYNEEMSFVYSNSSMNQEDALVHYGLKDPDDVKSTQNVNRLQSYSEINVGPRINLAGIIRDSEIASMDYRFNNTDLDGEVDDKTLLNHINTNALTKITKHLANTSNNLKKNTRSNTRFSNFSQLSAKTSNPRTGRVFAVDTPPKAKAKVNASPFSHFETPLNTTSPLDYSKHISVNDIIGK
jgi:hypothetical protein